jgi:hypothetical protein
MQYFEKSIVKFQILIKTRKLLTSQKQLIQEFNVLATDPHYNLLPFLFPGPAEIQDTLQLPVTVSDQPDGDPRLKRSPHRHFKGCYYCGYGGGGFYPQPYYVQPVLEKTVYVQPVYVKPAVYTQPVYAKPVYSQPYRGSGCSTCGQWGGGGGSFSYSQSSASSSSYGYGYG